jgi:hypothetical protein
MAKILVCHLAGAVNDHPFELHTDVSRDFNDQLLRNLAIKPDEFWKRGMLTIEFGGTTILLLKQQTVSVASVPKQL